MNRCDLCETPTEDDLTLMEIHGVEFCLCPGCVRRESRHAAEYPSQRQLLSDIREKAARLVVLIDACAGMADKAIHFQQAGNSPAAVKAMAEFNDYLKEIDSLRRGIAK